MLPIRDTLAILGGVLALGCGRARGGDRRVPSRHERRREQSDPGQPATSVDDDRPRPPRPSLDGSSTGGWRSW